MEVFRDIFSQNMKVSGILVISVIIKLHNRVVFRDIFSLYMKASNILVISVIIKLHNRVILRNIFSPYIKVSINLVIRVIIKLYDQVITRLILQQSTPVSESYPLSFTNITLESIRMSIVYFTNILGFHFFLLLPSIIDGHHQWY